MPPLPGAALRDLAAERELRVGSAVRAGSLDERAYRGVLTREFSAATPENAMKWEFVEPEPGEFDFEEADAIVDAARAAGMQVRGHTLVWHNQLPGWVFDLPAAELRAALERHVKTVVRHFRGRVAVWDVVNEPIGEDGELRDSVFLDKLGPGYIAQALRWAREADPGVVLAINDFGVEAADDKREGYLDLVRRLLADGAPLQEAGFQAHFTLDGPPPVLQETLELFAAEDLAVAITEHDVRVRLPASPEELQIQAEVYRDTLDACLAVDACRSFTVWGFTDAHSWISETQEGFGAATLLDEDLRPKPAYRAVRERLARGG